MDDTTRDSSEFQSESAELVLPMNNYERLTRTIPKTKGRTAYLP